MTTATAEYGYTLWGRDFLRIAEPTSITKPEPLLPRARSLARNGVTDVVTEGRLIRGTVVRGGDASVAYLEFAPMPRQAAQRIADIAGSAPSAAALTEDAHAAIGGVAELVTSDCSCRARSARCVHMLALVYETVRRVDEDPRLALQLRGFHESIDGPIEAESIPRWTPLSAIDTTAFFGDHEA